PQGRELGRIARGIGVATNNVAEYTAALEGLRLARELGATTALLRSDSRLLVEQLTGRFRVKNPTLQRLHQEVRTVAKSFRHVSYEHVPRTQNRAADALANEGVDAWLAAGGSVATAWGTPRLWDSEPGSDSRRPTRGSRT